MNEYLDWLQLVIVMGWACVGIGRGMMLYRRGFKVLAPDPKRTWVEVLVDLATGLCLLFAFWEVIAYSMPVPFHFGFGFLGVTVLDWPGASVAGAFLQGLSLVVYGRALVDLGLSWRLGIDREAQAELVSRGIYAWCRHPIYFAFDIFVGGSFLVTGRLVFLALLLPLIPLLHLQMRREERFLAAQHGLKYREYCARVRRYVVW